MVKLRRFASTALAAVLAVWGTSGALASPTVIIDNTPGTAVADGVVNVGEYVGFSTGINGGFGDVIGAASELHIDTDGSGTLSLGLVSGGGSLFDAVVIYIDTGTGGFGDTSSFTDVADGLRRAISATDGTNRSDITFAGGFDADFAIGIEAGFAGLWELTTGSHTFVNSASLIPSGDAAAGQWELTLSLADLGLAPGATFRYVATYLNSGNAFRSDEFHGVAAATVPPGNIGQASVSLGVGDYNAFQAYEAPVAAEVSGWGQVKALFGH
jgi:hypothetical protein